MRGYRALILAAWMLIGSVGMTAQAAPTATPQALNGLSRGDEVVLVQSRLRDLGYYNYKITGQYGHVTEEAVSAFQKQNGLDDDGTVGGETMKRLFSNDAKRVLFNAREPIATPTPRPTPVPTKKPTPKPTDKPEAKKTKATATPTGKKATAEPTKKGAKTDASDEKKATKTPKVTSTPKPKATKAPESIKSNPDYVAPKEAAPGFGRMAEWKEVNSTWGRGETVTVKDLRTGLQYRMYRMGGSNHADVEPASYEDCMTFKRTYGGSFSWDRRPVLVKINGEWIAGSTNGMPHGKQTISGNGMDGQVCIHFLNSRTHNHNAKDGDHQRCIKEAAGM